ncbi:hypothetical protein Tco_0456390 [Tanacetum coccineum]
MADENVLAPAPTRPDDQILLFVAWVPIGKSNFVLDLQKKEALEITPIDQAHQFVSPLSGDEIMDFMNDLGQDFWEEFVQAIQTFLTNKANLGSPTKKGRKESLTLFLIVGSQILSSVIWEELIIVTKDQHLHFILLKKISDLAPYYNAYLEMVAKHDQKIIAKQGGNKKPTTAKQPKPKPAKEKSSKPTPAPKPKLVDEPNEEPTQREPEPEPETEYQGEAEATRPLPVVEGKGKAITTDEQAAQSLLALHTPKRRSTTDQFIFQRRTSATEEASTGPSAQPQDDTSANIVRGSPSPADAKTGADTDRTNSREDKTTEIDEGQTGSDPGKTPESRPPPDDNKMDEDQTRPDPGESHVALAGPNPEPTHSEFMANVYPNVQESLKFLADEHIILEEPLSSSGTLSSMKNLYDAYTIRDEFLNDKSTKDKPGKLNVDSEVVSMVTVPIHQASSSISPLSTPIIDLSPPKPVSFTTQAPVFTATTTTTATTLPPPPQQQSTTESELTIHVAALEKKFSNLEQKNKNLDNTTRNLRSRVFTLELRDLPYKIDEIVRETVKVALKATLRDRFRDLPKADMKEMLHQRMFESGSYKLLPEHVALYEALEASMERAQKDEFFDE